MAEKKEYPRKMPLAPVDDATSAPPKTGASRLGRPTPKTTPPTPTPTPKPETKTSKTGASWLSRPTPKPETKTSKTGASPSSRPTPKTPPTSDELERRYDKLRQKDLNAASMTGKPTGYKKGGSIDKPKPKPMPLPTRPSHVPPRLIDTKPLKPVIKKFAKGGSTASKRADGCATKGKTKGKMV